MGSGTAQQQASAGLSNAFAGWSSQLSGIGLPAIQDVLGQYFGDLGAPGTEPDSVKNMFAQARNSAGAAYDSAELSSSAAIATRAKSMGLDYRPDAVAASQSTAINTLEGNRASTLQDLSQQEATYGLNQTDYLLGQMGNIEAMLAQGATGGGYNAFRTLGSLSNTDPWQSVLGGAAGGAASGASIGGPYGAIFGALAGAGFGYAESGGG